ncbi:MAG: DUF2628 domain-containing protein [Pseudomonadota bacterium]
MVAYTVYEPEIDTEDKLERAERMVFIKDGFNVFAAAAAPIWMLFNRMWIVFALYCAVATVFTVIVTTLGLPPAWVAFAQAAFNILIGFEADALKRWSLERSGWRMAGTVSGRTTAECERRFFDDWLPRQSVVRVGAGPVSGLADAGAPALGMAPAGAGSTALASGGGTSGGSKSGGFGWFSVAFAARA